MMRYRISKIEVDSKWRWLIYDLRGRCLCDDLTDYADKLVNDGLSPLTIGQEIGSLLAFWEFLHTSRKFPSSGNDAVLRQFKEMEFENVMRNPISRGRKECGKRTVNAKLRRIYLWFAWAQGVGRVPKLMGPRDSSILSSLLTETASALETAIARRWYPLEYRLKTDRSKYSIPRYVPTEADVDALHAHFFEQAQDPYTAHRNALIVDIANATGFRRGSINSLLVTQFIKPPKATKPGFALLRPEKQKNGYGDIFEVPEFLIERISSFVLTYREDLIGRKRISRASHQDRLFLSARDGLPLVDGTVTSIVSKALRTIGAPKGFGPHSFRSKVAIEGIESDFESRLARGADTSDASLAASAAALLGHHNVESQKPYVAYVQSKQAALRRAARQTDMNRYRTEKRVLEARNQELEREVLELKAKARDG